MIILQSIITAVFLMIFISIWSEMDAFINRIKYKKISFDEFMIWCEKCNKANSVSAWTYADREYNYGIFELFSSFIKYDGVYFRFSLKDTFRYRKWRKKVLNEKRIKREENAMNDIQKQLKKAPEVKTIYFTSEEEAEKVVDELRKGLEHYGKICISDYYDICGFISKIDGEYDIKDIKLFGWNYDELYDFGYSYVYGYASNCWTIDMPEPVLL